MITIARWREVPRRVPIHLFGAGRGGRLLKAALERRGIRIAGVVDNAARGDLDGALIRSPAEFAAGRRGSDVVLIASYAFDDIARQLEDLGVANVCNAYPLVKALLLDPVRIAELAALALTLAWTGFRIGLMALNPRRRPIATADRPLRVIHCPFSVGGHPQGLARAEREAGLDSRSLLLEQNYLNYKSDEVLWEPGLSSTAREIRRLKRFVSLVRDADVVHFNFGSTLLCRPDTFTPPPPAADWRQKAWHWLTALYQDPGRLLDARILRWFGTPFVVTYQGDDARQGEYARTHFAISVINEIPDYFRPESDAQKRRAIEGFARLAGRIYALNPDLLYVLPGHARFVPYAHLDIARTRPKTVWAEVRSPIILAHAPTHRLAKGTRFVEAALEEARRRGASCELLLIEKMEHAAAMRAYAEADLFVDQVLSGWYGGLAVEVMALGIPVICHLRPEDFVFLPKAMADEIPVVHTTPDTLSGTLYELLSQGREHLKLLGERSRRFVERWHDPRRIADSMIEDYRFLLEQSPARAGTRSPASSPGATPSRREP